jgi:hypothetical protein
LDVARPLFNSQKKFIYIRSEYFRKVQDVNKYIFGHIIIKLALFAVEKW